MEFLLVVLHIVFCKSGYSKEGKSEEAFKMTYSLSEQGHLLDEVTQAALFHGLQHPVAVAN